MVILPNGCILARLRRRGKPFVLGRLLSFVWFFSVNAHPKNTVVRPLLSPWYVSYCLSNTAVWIKGWMRIWSARLPAAATGFASPRFVVLRVDARQQHAGRFVVGVLRHQLAAKGLVCWRR